jgi:PASTA domain
MKRCPHCGELIRTEARKCRYCRRMVDDPIEPAREVTVLDSIDAPASITPAPVVSPAPPAPVSQPVFASGAASAPPRIEDPQVEVPYAGPPADQAVSDEGERDQAVRPVRRVPRIRLRTRGAGETRPAASSPEQPVPSQAPVDEASGRSPRVFSLPWLLTAALAGALVAATATAIPLQARANRLADQIAATRRELAGRPASTAATRQLRGQVRDLESQLDQLKLRLAAKVRMWSVDGKNVNSVSRTFAARGWKVKTSEVKSKREPGTIVAQFPPPGTLMQLGAVVKLTIAKR